MLHHHIKVPTPKQILANLKTTPEYPKLENLTKAIKITKVKGLWLEFGVYKGTTINHIATQTTNTIYGFDSFTGLTESWHNHSPGWFSLNGKSPTNLKPNISLVIGQFQYSLPKFLLKHPQLIAFIHIDSDTYSAAKTILTHLHPRFQPGTVIIFDELYNYSGYRKHELKAWYEYTQNHPKLQYKWISHGRQQATLRIIK